MGLPFLLRVTAVGLTALCLNVSGLSGGISTVSASTNGRANGTGNVTATSQPTAVSATIRWNALRQPIVGFGGSGAFGMAQTLQYLPGSERAKVMTLLFSPKKGIGLTIVRSLVNDGTDGGTIEPSLGHWDWSMLPDDQVWLMQAAETYGVTTLMSTPWSPPAWMKENNAISGDGVQSESQGDTTNKLKPSDYHAYAQYLAHYVNGYWTHFHIRINAISVQNEPNWNAPYASSIWTPEELHTFIRQDLIPVFKEQHVQAKVMMPESLDWSEDMALPTLEDPVTAKAVSIVAAHGYSGDPAPLSVAESEHKQVWETETSDLNANDPSIQNGLKWATTVNQYLTVANVNAWNYWWLVDTQADGGGLIYINNGQVSLTKRLFTIGNYSRFVRPGFYRLEAPNNPSSGVYLSAFKDPKTGHFAVVVVNNNPNSENISVKLSGLTGGPKSVVPYVTSEKDNLKAGVAISVLNNGFTASLEANSVTTFSGN